MSENVQIRLVAVDNVSSVMQSVAMKTQHIAQNNALRIVQIERTKAQKIKSFQDKEGMDAKVKADKIKQIEQNASNQIIRIKENEALRIKQINERLAADQKRFAALQNLGAKAGRGAVAGGMGQMFAGTGSGRLIGAGSSGFAAGGLAGGMAGIAVGAASMFLEAVQRTSDLIVGGAKQVAESMVGAITQIGGGFSIKDTIMREAKSERQAATLMSQLMIGGTDLSKKFIMEEAGRASKGSEFRKTELLAGAAGYQKLAGDLSKENLNPVMQKIADLTTFAGGELTTEQVGELLGRVKSSFPNLDQGQLDQVVNNLIAQGASGSVEFSDLPALAKALGNAYLMQGDPSKNIGMVAGLAQLSAPLMGGPEEAATGVSNLYKGFATNKGLKRRLGIREEGGKILNMKESLAEAVVQLQSKGMGALEGLDARGQRVVTAMRAKVGDEGTAEERRARTIKLVEDLENAGMSAEKFSEALGEQKGTLEYQLKTLFGQVEEVFAGPLVSIISNSVLPQLQKFASFLESVKGQEFIEKLESLASKMAKLGGSVIDSLINNFGTLEKVVGLVVQREIMKGKADLQLMGLLTGTDVSGLTTELDIIEEEYKRGRSLTDEEKAKFRKIREEDPFVGGSSNLLNRIFGDKFMPDAQSISEDVKKISEEASKEAALTNLSAETGIPKDMLWEPKETTSEEDKRAAQEASQQMADKIVGELKSILQVRITNPEDIRGGGSGDAPDRRNNLGTAGAGGAPA